MIQQGEKSSVGKYPRLCIAEHEKRFSAQQDVAPFTEKGRGPAVISMRNGIGMGRGCAFSLPDGPVCNPAWVDKSTLRSKNIIDAEVDSAFSR